MAEIVNLRMARKSRARAEREKQAEENRRRHGVGAAERKATTKSSEQHERHLDHHRIDRGD